MALTIQDLAKKLGLAVGTVSGAINNNPAISRSTRKRVVEAARKYGYRPNKAARALIKNDSITVGIIFGSDQYSISSPFYSNIIAGASTYLADRGRDVSILSIPVRGLVERRTEPQDAAVKESVLNKLSSAVQGGLFRKAIIMGNAENDHLEMLRDMGASIVYAGNYPLPEWVSRVSEDVPEATRLLVQEAAGLGYESVLHFGTDDAPPSSIQFELARGLREACKAAGLRFDLVPDHRNPDIIREAAGTLGPRAVIAPGNEAVGAMTLCVLLGMGRAVPDEVGIASFGNTFLSLSVVPKLTTVDFHFEELGRRAAELAVADEPDGTCWRIEPSLVRRETLRGWEKD